MTNNNDLLRNGKVSSKTITSREEISLAMLRLALYIMVRHNLTYMRLCEVKVFYD